MCTVDTVDTVERYNSGYSGVGTVHIEEGVRGYRETELVQSRGEEGRST